VKQTIRVLEKTKSAFKSKDLGAMCKRLEELMETTKKNQEISKLDRYNSWKWLAVTCESPCCAGLGPARRRHNRSRSLRRVVSVVPFFYGDYQDGGYYAKEFLGIMTP